MGLLPVSTPQDLIELLPCVKTTSGDSNVPN